MAAKYFDIMRYLLELVLRLGVYVAVGIGDSEQMKIFLAIGSLEFAVFATVVAKRGQFGYAGFLTFQFEMVAVALQYEVASNGKQCRKSEVLANMLAYVADAFVDGEVLHYVALLVAVGETELALAFDFHLLYVYVAHFGILVQWRRQSNLYKGVGFEAFANQADKFVHEALY